MSSSSHQTPQKPDPITVRKATQAVGISLGSFTYGIVGGAALVMLGSRRETEDVDFVVPKGETRSARSILKQQPFYFNVEARTLHTSYKSSPPVEVDILTPPALFKLPFDASTPTISIDDVKILKPTLILRAKIQSIVERSDQPKKETDARDIKYLLFWLTTDEARKHECVPSEQEVPSATADFVGSFVSMYGGEDLWLNAGFDFVQGRFP